MVIDSSAIMAILLSEPESDRFMDAILSADAGYVSASTLVETAIVVLGRRLENGEKALDVLLSKLNIQVSEFTKAQAEIARQAYRLYGKGKAGLNFGDCFSYALAKDMGAPLLFKGTDFGKTDVLVAEY